MIPTPAKYPTKHMRELFAAIRSLNDDTESAKFFRDLLTIPELEEFANRWQIVKLLIEGKPYLTISEKLGVSTATVTRVAQWYKNGTGGYRLVAERILGKK